MMSKAASTVARTSKSIPNLPPGPKRRYPGEFMVKFQRDPIAVLRAAAARYGDVVNITGTPENVVLVSHPDLIRDVLVTKTHIFKKGRGLEHAKRFLGEGLLTSEGDFHLRQRRMMAPAFHRKQIQRYADIVAEGAETAANEWRDGQEIDIMSEMLKVTMPIVAKTLFGASMQEQSADIQRSLTTAMELFRFTMLPFAGLLMKFPLPAVKRLQEAEKTLHRATLEIIQARKSVANEEDADLLALLLGAQDSGDGTDEPMPNQQIYDEVLTLFIAGHETTSVWLTWTFYALAQNPEVAKKLHEELYTHLGGKTATYDSLANLPYTRAVLNESLRLYPPAWVIGRRALEDTQIGEFDIKAGTIVLLAPIVTHVDARYWPDPMHFMPERWLDEEDTSRPKFAFFPFGGGPRICIGDQFAWMEATILLATLSQKWSLEMQPGAVVTAKPMVTLRPKNGMPMRILARK